MARGIDAVLREIDGGAFDIQIGFDGDILTEDFFDTAIIVSVFTDRRANESEVRESHMRRGWIGNEDTPGIEYGSKVWLYEQARITRSTMNDIAGVVKDALQWFVDDAYAVAVQNPVVTLVSGGLRLEVKLERPNSKVVKRYFDLWHNSGLGDS